MAGWYLCFMGNKFKLLFVGGFGHDGSILDNLS